jgi:hypothetical protein
MESIEEINRRLADEFGKLENLPRYRVVFSNDQLEKRLTKFTDSGIELLFAEVREVPKYQDISNKWILEKLYPSDMFNDIDTTEKLFYTVVWTFKTPRGEKIQPSYGACKFVCELIENNMRGSNTIAKYKEDNETKEQYEARIKKIEEDLFGNESSITDALAYQHGVSFAGVSKMGEN